MPRTPRTIGFTYEIPSHHESAFAQAISKVLTQLPKSAPITTVQKSENRVTFDLRYISPMLWQHTKLKLQEVDAKVVETHTI